jgi:acyl carrier protein
MPQKVIGAEIFGALIGVAAVACFLGLHFSRKKFLRGRLSIQTLEIVKDLPSGIDSSEAERLLRVIAKSFGVKAEILRLDDSLDRLIALDSWKLGEGQDELERWLKAEGVTSFKEKPATIRDLIVAVLSSIKNKPTSAY